MNSDRSDPGSAGVRYLKGIGPRRAEFLSRIGIETVEDLLYHFPRSYQDRRFVKPISSLREGETVTVVGAVMLAVERGAFRRGLRSIFEVDLRDHTGSLSLIWFNQPHLANLIKPGMRLLCHGRVRHRRGELQMSSPEWDVLDPEEIENLPPIVPVYPLTEGIRQAILRRSLSQTLERDLPRLPEIIPEPIRRRANLLPRREAIRILHLPPMENTDETLEKARRTLVFEEFLLFGLSLSVRKRVKQRAYKEPRPLPEKVRPGLCEAYLGSLPFRLTAAQRRVIGEIRGDLTRPAAMERLLQGDVGSGKTAVIIWALLWAVEHGLQGAFMAPTEILAEQHFRTVSRLTRGLEVSVSLLTGSTRKAGGENGLLSSSAGEADIAVGTHALFQDRATFRRLGLAVIDEQHKFGVVERERLLKKGDHSHLLITSATPIPRTLALTVYGDLDVSVIDRLPPGRKPVVTRWTQWSKVDKVYGFLRDRLKSGRQLYIVCPLVEESEKMPHLAAAEERFPIYADEVFPGIPTALLHGRTPSEEREQILSRFEQGDIRVLVATTVIEVGIDVARASLMLIENAERFGLSQLHQMRGRIGRGAERSYCLLLTGENVSEIARKRMEVLEATSDGFRVAEEDLALRGPGEFMGTRQSGALRFRLANLIRDEVILVEARTEAENLLSRNPSLEGDDLAPIRAALKRKRYRTA